MHIHAFSPLEVWQGASTLGISLQSFLGSAEGRRSRLVARHGGRDLGRRSPRRHLSRQNQHRAMVRSGRDRASSRHQDDGDDHVRPCRSLPALGAASVAAARLANPDRRSSPNLFRCRSCRWRRQFICAGLSRLGPTYREAVLMHAIARLALHPVVKNIQTSWVKMGRDGAAACLAAGANDLGGTLMNESITRAAGAVHGEEMPPEAMEDVITSLGRRPRQRTTLYGEAAGDRTAASFDVAPLRPSSASLAHRFAHSS